MKKELHKEIVLANPRGFCAGVDRAIDIVEKSLDKYKEPVYVRHQVVHNKKVVEDLEKKGVKFVKEVSEIPEFKVPFCNKLLIKCDFGFAKFENKPPVKEVKIISWPFLLDRFA